MSIQKADKIWFNGQFVPWDEAKVHVLVHALHYGSSVFEGIRAYATPQGPAVFCLDDHLDRLFGSCKIYRMSIPYSKEELRRAILETVRVNKHRACYIRPLIFWGYDTLHLNGTACPVEVVIATWEWGQYLGAEVIEQGVDVCVSSWRRMAPDTFPAMAKIGGQYISSQLITMEATVNGYTEGIGLDVNGYVSEGSGENIFLMYQGALYTPPIGTSILAGVTRRCIITLARELGYEVREELIPREMLYIADEVFFTGTAAEITPIRSVDRIPVGDGKRGKVTRRLQERFFAITSGEAEDKYGWLTYVK
ncbi:MAG: branched chain amino acid aminotransferase [Chloroflexota bacterium]|nr:MAG: branched chain amino acid aminotransferase [Chloroflexota bacterium]